MKIPRRAPPAHLIVSAAVLGVSQALPGGPRALPGAPEPASAQARVVDEGSFRVLLDGEPVGREQFAIRSVGDSYLANGSVQTEGTSLSTLLRARAPDGESEAYELSSEAPEPFAVAIPALSAPRFNSTYTSDAGQESREYPGSPLTRVLEAGVAHHHFFLATLDRGAVVPVIIPGERRSGRLEVTAEEDDELVIGGVALPARKLTLSGLGGGRSVWFDARNRVMRVEVAERGYVAERIGAGSLLND